MGDSIDKGRWLPDKSDPLLQSAQLRSANLSIAITIRPTPRGLELKAVHRRRRELGLGDAAEFVAAKYALVGQDPVRASCFDRDGNAHDAILGISRGVDPDLLGKDWILHYTGV
ncbi:MAG: hypothetical protein OXP37_01940 [Chloroflexota bacterium]|nr:hypothetical protein [Chloroflexota bacterium]